MLNHIAGKGINGVIKKRNIPVIVLANKSPEEVYKNVAKDSPALMQAFKGRFVIVDCSHFIEGEDFIDIPWTEVEDLRESSEEVPKVPTVIDLLKSNSVLQLPEDEYECEKTELVEDAVKPNELTRSNQFNAWYDQIAPQEQSSEEEAFSQEDHSAWSLEHNHNN